LPCVFILDYPRFGRQTVFWGECLKIQKRQLIRNEVVALNFIILGISQTQICADCSYSLCVR
ncbi:hypothetical protein, partial [Bacteroides finegoldii]|uniref:hypothetical protein n=1 Tax=Bacteroides finegoldii TaxID=338188 RepID=UPI00242E74B6